ncbi:MAG: OmpA family protein [Tannerellaceae bacterium]|jgi:outer membrane protein OmpA-like peptidoglycan-associated protein|nr:OmpA family protein [Tannerellaceae bacterium]
MKANKVLLPVLFAGIAGYAAAQEFVPFDGYSTNVGYKTHFLHNKAGDNWFVSLAGGVNLFYGDRSMEAGLLNQYSIIPQLSFGKWFNPYLAFRVQALGGQVVSPLDLEGEYTQGGTFAAAHADILLDVTNLWAPYNEKRLFRLIPWLGLGYTQRFRVAAPEGFDPQIVRNDGYAITISDDGEFPRSESPTLNAGILTAFRLTQRLDLNVEVQGSLMNETFNRMAGKQLSDALIQGTVGLTWEFGKPTFQVLEPKDYAQLKDMNDRINTLREENNDLRNDNKELRKRPVSCPECPPAAAQPTTYKGADQVIYFRFNNSVVESNQHTALFTLAEFVTKHNTAITVTGFADRKTGSAKYNTLLSEKRAKAVADILADKFSVPRSLITVEWKGGDEQPYTQNNWNRVVIISVTK